MSTENDASRKGYAIFVEAIITPEFSGSDRR